MEEARHARLAVMQPAGESGNEPAAAKVLRADPAAIFNGRMPEQAAHQSAVAIRGGRRTSQSARVPHREAAEAPHPRNSMIFLAVVARGQAPAAESPKRGDPGAKSVTDLPRAGGTSAGTIAPMSQGVIGRISARAADRP